MSEERHLNPVPDKDMPEFDYGGKTGEQESHDVAVAVFGWGCGLALLVIVAVAVALLIWLL